VDSSQGPPGHKLEEVRGIWLVPLALLACKDEIVVDRNVTGIELTISYDPASGIDQIELSGSLEDGTEAFATGRLPETPRALTEGENTLVLLLPDAMAGQTITVRADGLVNDSAVSTVEIAVVPLLRELVTASGRLAPLGRCGDGSLGGEEACDDGNAAAGDGCSEACAVERGHACSGSPSVCAPVCGDGLVVKEACDDNNGAAGDGCTGCELDPGYTCTGEPSQCTCEGDSDGDGITDCEDTCLDADGDTYGRAGGAADTCAGPDCDDTSAQCTTACDDLDADQLFDCKDDCIDADADRYGSGTGCLGPDCDDMIATCTSTCTGDLDADGTVDCADGCQDEDGDLYGEPGGAADTCLGPDCDETSTTCNLDCTADADGDGTVDCNDTCLDADGDGYGNAGPAGNSCLGADCSEASATCNVDCAADADGDGTIDCDDGCLDQDGDGYGVAGPAGGDCAGPDCDDSLTSCNTNCTTNLDNDGLVDCADTCIDRDGDTYGAGGGAGNTCAAPDCNDDAATCRTDCATNVDLDGTPDCADTCLDRDGDGYGAAGGAGNTCTAADCDDLVGSCTTDCNTNVDGDAIPDCRDGCIDFDGDNYGIGAGCTGADCDDAIDTCAVNCVANLDGDGLIDCNDPCIDSDGDGYGTNGGAGACAGADCDETRVACNTNCNACLPNSLVLTSNSPVARCTDATLTVDLDNYDNAAGDLTCAAPQIAVLPLETFANGFGRWARSSFTDVTIRTFPDGFPASCNTAEYVRINDRGPDYIQLSTPINATNLMNLSVSARIGYDTNTDAGDNLAIQGCCGAGCTPVTFQTVLNGSSGGTDNCTDIDVTMPAYANNCASLMIRFSYPNASDNVGIDNIQVFGDVTAFGAFTETAQGVYDSLFRVCEATTVPVTCTWDNGVNTPRSDAADVVFQ
jgi:hypothetical protein